jgi:hypothetical protein
VYSVGDIVTARPIEDVLDDVYVWPVKADTDAHNVFSVGEGDATTLRLASSKEKKAKRAKKVHSSRGKAARPRKKRDPAPVR